MKEKCNNLENRIRNIDTAMDDKTRNIEKKLRALEEQEERRQKRERRQNNHKKQRNTTRQPRRNDQQCK